MKKKTTEDFIQLANKVHGESYDYSRVVYEHSHSKLSIICKNCSTIFEQRAYAHLNGQGCGQCHCRAYKGTNDFITRASCIHGESYSYGKTQYKGASKKLTISCPKHGDFEQRADIHLAGHGCPTCGNETKTKTLDNFIEQARDIHGSSYSYEYVEYKNAYTNVKIICPIHGEFNQRPYAHLSDGHGCPNCTHTVSKNEVRFLDLIGIPEKDRQVKIEYQNKHFVVDGLDIERNTVYEFDGDFWHGNPDIYNLDDIHPVAGVTFGSLYRKTLEKKAKLEEMGYTVVNIWESQLPKFIVEWKQR